MIIEIHTGGQLKGWLQKGYGGRWLALTVSGLLSHHQSREAAQEALECF